MTGTLYLSRARLRSRRGEALASIAPLLLPDGDGERHAATHRLVWLLFQAMADAGGTRDWRATEQGFLWRDDGEGKFTILSRQPPTNPNDLFDLETRAFESALAEGDRLRIALRANPTRAVPAERGPDGKSMGRGKRVDVVMHALKAVPETDRNARTGRAFERDRIVTETSRTWFARQGKKHGFTLAPSAPFVADGYSQVRVERRPGKGKRPAGFSVVDVAGEILVTDPAAFMARLPLGFGSAKAFGCGLMLIRRA